jgi:P-type conjugative transfer protein TrbG
MHKIITGAVFVFLASTSWLAVGEEPAPSATPDGPAVLAQSPAAGVIDATTPAPPASATGTPAVAQASPSPNPVTIPAVGQASPASSLTVDASSAAAAAAAVPTPASKFSSSLLGGQEPELNAQERAGVQITEAWRQRSYESMVSQAGTTGSVLFKYDQSYPSIVCAILQVTDIELEPGEVVTQVNLGDTTRWSVESAVSGSGSEQTQHLIVKPRDIGLTTSLVVTTDHRTYHLMLVSDGKEFMHSVRFVYEHAQPASTAAPLVAPAPTPQQVAADPPRRRQTAGGKRVALVKADEQPVDDTDDGYLVSGKADWKPVTVYSKGGKTYIEMPASVRHKEAPVLFEETKKGWFHHEKILVNYRVDGRWYVVDKVIDKGTLVSGVGSNQTKVDIRHVETRKPVIVEEKK